MFPGVFRACSGRCFVFRTVAGPNGIEDRRPVIPVGRTPPSTLSRAGDAVQPLVDAVSNSATRSDQEVVELALLLPLWQAMQLEAAASRRGMTTGQMLRRVIGELLASQTSATVS
jgi:hypothetical protein